MTCIYNNYIIYNNRRAEQYWKNGTKIVSVTVEKSLLRRADAFAKANGLNRSKLFAISDEAFVKSAKLLFSPGNSIILR